MQKTTEGIVYNILKTYGNKIGLNLPYFTKNGFWILVRYVAIGLSGLAISIGFTRLGTKELFGKYQFILNFLAFWSFLSLPGLNTAALKEVALGNDGAVKRAVKYSFLCALFAIPVLVGYGIMKLNQGDADIAKTLIFAGIIFPFFYAPNTWSVFFEGKLHFKSSSIRIIANNLILALFILVGLFLKAGLFKLVAIYLLINVFFNWVFYAEVIKKTKGISGKIDLKYGIECTLQKFTNNFSETIPALIITVIFGFEATATYQIAYFLVALATGFIAALSSLYMPLLFKYDKLNHIGILFQNLIIGVLFFAGFFVFVRSLFFIFYGRSYQDSYALALIFSFAIIFIPLKNYLFNFFIAKQRNKFLTLANLGANLLALTVFYLIKKIGFNFSVPVYFYLFNFLVLVPLLFSYFFMASKKTPSI